MIEVENLTKDYGKFRAVEDVSFFIPKGEIVGFLGPNGAGKTTVMKILTCFMPASSGKAKVGDYDVFENPYEVKKLVGYLPEHTPLYEDMTVKEYLKYVGEIRQLDDISSSISKQVSNCGLKKVYTKMIGHLSKGYRQRVCLAQSLLHEPEVLILDEPTSGLDPGQKLEIKDLIKEIGKKRTVIFSTHILPEVEATCSKIIIINNGKKVASGRPSELSESQGIEKIFVTIKSNDNYTKIINTLNALEGLEKNNNKPIEIDKNTFQYELKSPKNKVSTEAIFNLAVKNNWILTELRKEALNLENIFLKLTGKGKE